MVSLILILACAEPSAGSVDSAPPEESAVDPWGDLAVPEGGSVTVSGFARAFGLGWILEGGEISIVELPDRRTTADADGAWSFEDLPRGTVVTFQLDHPDVVAIRTGSFLLGSELDGGDRLEDVTFQAPDPNTYALMASATGTDPLETDCQIATTVTRLGHSMLTPSPTHGEPGATASLSPDAAWEAGPIYFHLEPSGFIWPDPSLTETTHDGGVLWANVPPGRYLMEGAKEGAVIRPVKIDCVAGYLINASPPWGLQVLEGGLDPDDPDFGL